MKAMTSGQPARLFLPLLFSIFFALAGHATAIFSKQSGAWTSPSTWQGNVVPTNFNDVVIKAGHTVTRNNAFVSQGYLYVYGTLVYQGNVAREFYFGTDIEIQGILRMEGGSLFADGMVYGNGTFRQTAGSTTFGRAYVLETTDIQGGTVFWQNTNNGNLILDNLSLKNATATANPSTDLNITVSMNWYNGGKFGGSLNIQEGASLNFISGNNTFSHSGFLNNHGVINAGAGSLVAFNSTGYIFNYGLIHLNTPANSGFGVYGHNVYNYGEIKKTGTGGASFEASGTLGTTGGSVLHIIQGGITMHTSSTDPQYGLWQVDAGASLLVFAEDFSLGVPFYGAKLVNNGNIYGRLKLAGIYDISLEGGGSYSNLEIAMNGARVNLAGSPKMTESFVLSSGLVRLNNYDLRLADALVVQNSFDSYVETNGTGNCVRTCAVGEIRTFPVGNNGFAPLTVVLQAGSTADDIKVRVVDQFYGEYNGGGVPLCTENVATGTVLRNWYVGEQVPGGSSALMYGVWSSTDEQSEFDRNNCTLGRYANGDWQPNEFGAAVDDNGIFLRASGQATALGLFGVFDGGHTADVNFTAPSASATGPACEWSDVQLFANTSPNAQVSWAGPNGYQSDLHDPVLNGILLSQSGYYTVQASQNGCPAKQSTINVQVIPTPDASILGPAQIQQGETAILTAYGAPDFEWSTGATTQGITVSPAETTDYQVTVTNAAGCSETAEFTLIVNGGATAVKETEGVLTGMSVAPNPAVQSTVLHFESVKNGAAQLILMDARGVQVQRRPIDVNAVNAIEIPLVGLPAGWYQLVLIKENEVKTMPLVKAAE